MKGIIAEATAPHELLAVGANIASSGYLEIAELSGFSEPRCGARLWHIRSESRHLKIMFRSSISIQSRRRLLLILLLSLKARRSLYVAHAFF
jgi:hypothetical protein